MILTGTSRQIKARQSLYGKRKALKQFVIITPENPMGVKASAVDNANFRKKFEDILKTELLYAYPVRGKYGNTEHSYIVFNMPLELAKRVGSIYDQQSFILGKVIGENEVEYQLWWKNASSNDNRASFKDKQYYLKETKREVIRVDGSDMDYTEIGKGFQYNIPFETFEAVDFYDNLFDERCQKSKLYEAEYQDLIAETISDNYTTMRQIHTRSRLYGNSYLFYYENPESKTMNELLGI